MGRRNNCRYLLGTSGASWSGSGTDRVGVATADSSGQLNFAFLDTAGNTVEDFYIVITPLAANAAGGAGFVEFA